LKILLISESDVNIGGFTAVLHLLEKLTGHGIDVTLGVKDKTSSNNSIILLSRYSIFKKLPFFVLLSKIINKFKMLFFKHIMKFTTTNSMGYTEAKKTCIDIKKINNSDFDLVHLHWIYRDVISIEDLPKIKKPMIFTMHDSWIFCGAEYHPNVLENDQRFIEGYTSKNKPKTTHGRDICRLTWERKKRNWKNLNINFISPSNFEKELLQKSFLFKNKDCSIIPNVVPNEIFRKINKNQIRDIYNIPKGKKVICFGAAKITKDISIKGEYLLLEALKNKTSYDLFLIIFGNVDAAFINELNIPVFLAGRITNPYILSSFYNACDVFVCPSLVENLPMVCIEAQYCGLPVTAFRTGGIPDVIEHKETGYLATPYDTYDFFQGIEFCLENQEKLSSNSITRVNTLFNNDHIINQHINLYKRILETTKS
jgi:glycosyltransferase involved in cell wall biosynthesis